MDTLILADAVLFLSTLSLRRATEGANQHLTNLLHFYPRSPCGERRCFRCCAISCITISIHALLAESDPWDLMGGLSCDDFYPRSPCGERPYGRINDISRLMISIHALLAESDWGPRWIECRHPLFLSTLSLRRATCPPRTCPQFLTFYFYPRSPCGERLKNAITAAPQQISIHALLAESDPGIIFIIFDCAFLSTLSLRRATGFHKINCQMMVISIHALLAESD